MIFGQMILSHIVLQLLLLLVIHKKNVQKIMKRSSFLIQLSFLTKSTSHGINNYTQRKRGT